MKSTIILGGGCFWCTEAVFSNVDGVISVMPGYSGGTTENPSYGDVCSGSTGHAEVVSVEYDTDLIGTGEILEIFFATHDPTSLNRQGADVGTQYRSTIIYSDVTQGTAALDMIREMEKENVFRSPIVTTIEPYRNFFKAEEYHQKYYEKNPEMGYCTVVITPKLEKFRKIYAEKIRST